MNQDIFIGVDGGGTKSKIRIEDSEGIVLGQVLSGPANIRLSVPMAWSSILTGIQDILVSQQISLNNPHFNFHLGLGLAGCEVKAARRHFLETPHTFTTLKLITDAEAACIGAHNNSEGAIIIVGTGVVGYVRSEHKRCQVGGWGFPHSDEGGGAWLGLEATRLTFQWLDRRADKTPLAEDIYDYFNKDVDELIAWANTATSSDFAKLAPIVINHGQLAEVAALRLLKKAGHAIDKIAQVLLKENPLLSCCLTGGIAPFIEPFMHGDYRERIIPRKLGASAGAILMLRESMKVMACV